MNIFQRRVKLCERKEQKERKREKVATQQQNQFVER